MQNGYQRVEDYLSRLVPSVNQDSKDPIET
jgi:hypothetical protein